MWLENLRELKKEKGVTNKYIAEATNLPERTVTRIFSGDTDNPYVDTLHRIVTVLDGSLDSILADTKVVVGGSDLVTLQTEKDTLQAEKDLLQAEKDTLQAEKDALVTEVEKLDAELSLVNTENKILKDKIVALTAETDILRLKLEHKEEIIALHNYYIKMKTNE
jgi:transcriptional regulator with XRE-family HTH domain